MTGSPERGPRAEPSTRRDEERLDQATELVGRFGRYGGDALGVAALAGALLTLFGLLGWTQGVLLTPWVINLKILLGWGSILIVALLFLLGLAVLRRRSGRLKVQTGLDRLLALEAAAFLLLALFSVVGGARLDRAEAGLDGGLVGWSLAELPVALGLAPWLRTLLLLGGLAVCSLYGLGVAGWLRAWADRQLPPEPTPTRLEPRPAAPAAFIPPTPAEFPSEPPPAPAEKPSKGGVKLPPQFRKALKAEAPEPEVTQPELLPAERDPRLPPLALLYGEQTTRPDERQINLTAGLIEKTLAEFGIPARVVGFRVGPTVTQYAVEPGFVEKPGLDGLPQKQKVRVSQISGLARDLALALSAERLRIEAPVPGRSYVGIEVPNARSSLVRLRPIMESESFQKFRSPLAIALGRDVSGQPMVADLARMPHLLIAGTTGSGKSVCIAALTACLVVNNTPDTLRLAMIDPKMVELVRFNGLPHLLGRVETDLERILGVLRWALAEMDHRYRLLESARARDLDAYNRKAEKRGQPALPRIVLLIDELADLMMSAPDQTEHSLVRLAQMARAVGIHLVVATQRPSTDVVTGLIKANFPARIAFTVASSVDSRVILDTPGAETLLGRGDLLFLNPEVGNPLRAQGVWVTDQEIDKVQAHWQKVIPPQDQPAAAPWEDLLNESDAGSDTLVEQAIEVVRGSRRASASLLQRRLRIGYPRAARLLDELEERGVVGPSQGGGRERDVLIGRDDEDGEYSEET